MRTRLLVVFVLACLTLFARAVCAASEQPPSATVSSTGGPAGQVTTAREALSGVGEGAFAGGVWSEKVNLEFKDTPAAEVVTTLLKGAGISFVLSPDVPKDLRVTMSLQNIQRKDGLRYLCSSFHLDYRLEDSVVQIGRRAATQPTPIPPGGPFPFVTSSGVVTKDGGRAVFGTTTNYISIPNVILRSHLTERCESFQGDDCLVDLEVKDAPISDAISRVSKACKIPIHVHESVPKDLKVTASIYRMPLGDMLCIIASQAKLDWVVAPTGDKLEVQIVPKSELTISGTGVPSGTVSIALPRSDIDAARRSKDAAGAWVTGAVMASPRESLTTVICSTCHRTVLALRDWKFCSYCGAKLPRPAKPTGSTKVP